MEFSSPQYILFFFSDKLSEMHSFPFVSFGLVGGAFFHGIRSRQFSREVIVVALAVSLWVAAFDGEKK